MAISEEVIIKIRADMRDIDAKLHSLERTGTTTANKMSASFQRAGSRIGAAFSTLRTSGLVLAGAAVAFGAVATRSLAASEAIADLSARANVSAEFLQEMRFAINQSGGEARDFDDSISRLNRRLGLYQQHLATGTGEAGPAKLAFEALGLSAGIVNGTLATSEEVFNAAIEGLQGIESASRRSAIASQLFGEDSGPRLVALLDQGSAGIARLREEARSAGVVLEESLITQAAAASDQLEIMGTQFSATLNRAIAENASSIVTLGNALAHVARWGIEAGASFGDFIAEVFGANEQRLAITADGLRGQLDQLAALHTEIDLFGMGNEGIAIRPFSQQFDELEQIFGRQNLAAILSDAQQAGEDVGEAVAAGLAAKIALVQEQLALLAPSALPPGPTPLGAGPTTPSIYGPTEADYDPMGDHLRQFNERIQRDTDALQAFNDKLAEGKLATEDLADGIRDLAPAITEMGKTFEQTFINAIETGKLEVADLGRAIQRMFAQAAYNRFLAAPIDGLTNGIGSFVTSMFARHASGGQGSGLALVGEQGPELVNLGPMANVMNANMTRMALNGSRKDSQSGNVSVSNVFSIDARGSEVGVEARINAVLQAQTPRIQQDTVRATLQALAQINTQSRAM